MNLLVVAHHDEQTHWLSALPAGWQSRVITKGVELPNEGREASSWLLALEQLPPEATAVACVQGFPFDHCPDLMRELTQLITGFRWLGDRLLEADANHHGLPVGARCREWFGRPFPGRPFRVHFAPGGQFAVTADLVRRRPPSFYRELRSRLPPDGPWVLERLWETMFS